jgi:putative MATE family efflux protein
MQDLTSGSIPAQLTRLTVPMFLGIASMILASMVETVFIGVLGASELAAFSFTFPLVMGLSSISMGLGIGASSLIARAQGAGDKDRVRLLATHAMILTGFLVAVLTAAAYLFQHHLFDAMGATPDIIPLVDGYMNIWVLGLPLFTLPMVASTILRSVGNARLPGLIMTSTSAIGIVIAPLLIFGLLGLPEYGLFGSAITHVVIGVYRATFMGWVLIRTERLIVFDGRAVRGVVASAREILRIALPSMLSQLIAPVSMGIILALLAAHGAEVVAGFGITSRIEMLLMMVMMALSSSVGPFVGQNWGAGKTERIHEGLAVSYRFCLVWGLVCLALLGGFGDNLVALVNDDAALVESAGWYLTIVPVSFGVLGVGMISASVFTALGKPLPPMIMSLMRMLVVYVPLALWFDSLWGYIGIFIATLVANVVMGLTAFFWGRHLLAQVESGAVVVGR